MDWGWILFTGLLVGPILLRVFFSESYPGERDARRRQADRMKRERERRALNTARARDHMASPDFRPPTDYLACPPRVVVDAQGRRWQQITTATREPFDTGEWQGEARGISMHLQRILDGD